MKEKEFITKEDELLKLAEHFKDNEEHHDRIIIRNLIILYTKWDKIDKIKSLRNITNKRDLQNHIDSAVSLLETKNIKEEVEKSKIQIEKERIRSVEILGIFGVIIAFIISTAQFGATAIRIDLEIGSAIFLISSIALVLLGFIVALHLIVIEKRKSLISYLFFFLVISFVINQIFIIFQIF